MPELPEMKMKLFMSRKLPRITVLLTATVGVAFFYVMFSSMTDNMHQRTVSPGQKKALSTRTPSLHFENGAYCRPKKNIVFLKVHKCSSSTIQNILFRYGDKHNLNFVLPLEDNYLGRNEKFQRRNMIELPVKEYNILCHHTRYDEKNIVELMPPDTVYISTLRDPVTMFESMFTYGKYNKMLHLDGDDPITNLAQFLTKPRLYYDSIRVIKKMLPFYIGHLKNSMLYDFGLDIKNTDNQSAIDDKIHSLMTKFDLIMIAEYFHESLILLKDLLCWTLDDIVFFSLNARTKQYASQISPQMAQDIRHWNQGDVKLYNNVNRTFWKKVEEYGVEKMKREVTILTEYNKYLFDHCIENVGFDPHVWHPPGVRVDSLQVKSTMMNNSKCVKMATPELDYTAELRRKICHKYNIDYVTASSSSSTSSL